MRLMTVNLEGNQRAVPTVQCVRRLNEDPDDPGGPEGLCPVRELSRQLALSGAFICVRVRPVTGLLV